MSILRTESYRKGVFLSTVFNVLSKGIAFLNSILIAYFFGTNAETDVYFYALSVITLLMGLIVVVNTAVLVPEGMRIREQVSEEASRNFFNFFLFALLAAGSLISLLLFFKPFGFFTAISKFEAAKLHEHQAVIYWTIPLLVLMVLSQYLKDVLTSYKFFTIPTIISGINSLLAILLLLVFHRSIGIIGSIAGLITGHLLSIGFQLYLMHRRLHWRFKFKMVQVRRHTRRSVFSWYLSNLISIPCVNFPLFLFSGLGEGYVSAFNIGMQVSLVPTQFITTQFVSVMAVKFNELYARREYAALNQSYLNISRSLLFILVPFSGLIFLYSEEIITFFFKRGLFTDWSVQQSALFLKYLGLVIPFTAVISFNSIILMAFQKITSLFWFQIGSNVVLLGITYFCFRAFGLNGYFIALLSYHALNNLVMRMLFSRDVAFIQYLQIPVRLLLLLVVNGLLVAGISFLLNPLINHYLLRVAIGSAVYGTALLLINRYFKIDSHLNELLQSLRGRLKGVVG